MPDGVRPGSNTDEDAEGAQDVAEPEAKPAEKRNKVKPTTGKFAKWKKTVQSAFELVDEDAIEHMCFQLNGKKGSLFIQFGHNPLSSSQK